MSKDNENEKSPKPKFKNRSERNANYKTAASQIFGDKEMLLARPEGMSRDEFRILRKMQTEVLKRLFRKGHSPSRKLQNIMGIKQPTVRIAPGIKRRVNQRKSS